MLKSVRGKGIIGCVILRRALLLTERSCYSSSSVIHSRRVSAHSSLNYRFFAKLWCSIYPVLSPRLPCKYEACGTIARSRTCSSPLFEGTSSLRLTKLLSALLFHPHVTSSSSSSSPLFPPLHPSFAFSPPPPCPAPPPCCSLNTLPLNTSSTTLKSPLFVPTTFSISPNLPLNSSTRPS